MKRNFFYAIMLSIMLIITGCTTTTSKSEGSKEEKNILNISVGPDMLTWDIHNHTNTSTEVIHVNVFDYLLMRDTEGEIKPHLAKSWEKVDDTTYQFELNNGVKFHNGDELTSEDVKFTLERVAKDETLRSYGDFKSIKEVKIIDDYNFQIVTNEPDPMFLSRISRQASGILPKKYIEEKGWDEFLKSPIGSGPYKFKEWKKDNQIVLEKNEDYFGKSSDWDEVVFRAIPEDSTRVAELLTDNIDLIANVPPSDWKRVNDSENNTIVTGPSNRTYMLFIRTQKDWPTSDLKVRQAIDYAIDDQALIDSLLDGKGTPTLTRINPGNLGFEESLYNKYNYDVERSKELLAESGFKDGLTIELSGPTGRYIKDREILQMVAGMLEAVGIKTEMNIQKWSTFSEAIDQQKFKDGYLIALGSSFFDSGQSLDYYGSERASTINGYSNETVDQLLKEAKVSLDENERTQKYQEVQKIASQELPIIPLFQIDQFFGASKKIEYQPRLDELIYVPDIKKK
ncbi:ABC transporter substrate-binding protein [Cytobacillus depressus]|uniref:ABC transporter substrate-binding protein n=1 Tax=Cytobacillus depressus TaxID=1602942 RepID=A0A6L3VB03_9BACI|nr:ABC transporter substrate-binding protein [Cytobacillus depressus]KAB2336692.1 ABC transporter substrate-binding protein [Cytobacillus depressus]